MKKYRFFIKITLIFSVLISLIFGLGNYLIYKLPQSTLWINNILYIKDNYAKTINTPKIVFTSGSNTLFGVNTIDIEKALKIPTVNMATHAGLKTDYILHRTKKILKEGDIVVIPFEYQLYTWDGEQSATRTNYILTHDKTYFNSMDLIEKLTMIYSINIVDILRSIKQQIISPVKAEIGKGYNSDTLNINGDETYKNGNKFKTYKPFDLIEHKETKGLLKIKDFSNWCNKRNIKLFITYPNTINHKEYLQKSYLNYFKYLKEYFHKNEINTLGNPHDSMYPLKYFYDTEYHMNNKGAQIRTRKLLQEIKSKIL